MLKEILKIIEKNAQSTTKEIAAITGSSPAEVSRLIKKAEKDRVILKYKAIINWERLEDEMVWAWIEVKVTPEPEVGFGSIAENIYRFSQVRSAYLASGAYDLVILVSGKSMHEVSDFVSQKIAPIKGVQETVTHFMMKRYKEDGEVLKEEEEVKRQQVIL